MDQPNDLAAFAIIPCGVGFSPANLGSRPSPISTPSGTHGFPTPIDCRQILEVATDGFFHRGVDE
jgi:hypothetical protein